MTNFDLSGAIGAGAKAVREYPGIVYAQAHVATPQVSEAVIRAALPHILEALALRAERACAMDGSCAHSDDCPTDYVADWLRAKAEEVRA